MRELDLVGGPVRFEGAVSVESTPGGVQPWRLVHADRALHHPALVAAATCPAGVRLRWRSDTTRLAVDLEAAELPGHEGYGLPVLLDLVVDQRRVVPCTAGLGRGRMEVDDLPPGMKDLELWLPTAPAVRLHRLSVEASARGEAALPDRRPRWIVYGSSITQCSGIRPTRTWPAEVARRLGWHLTNLGYTGQCHLDPQVARMIAELPADRITLEVGINVHNWATLRERTFAPMVHGFLATLRDGHPTTPITVLSPIASPEREHSARSVLVTPRWTHEVEGDLSLIDMRRILAEVVAARQAAGDGLLTYLDGHELLGPADAHLLPDGLHPSAHGYHLMADRYVAFASPAVPTATAPARPRPGPPRQPPTTAADRPRPGPPARQRASADPPLGTASPSDGAAIAGRRPPPTDPDRPRPAGG